MKGPLESDATVERIEDEIRERMGLLPSFFRVAAGSPTVMAELWRQAQATYLDNPLPSLFKERLFAYLSRFCCVPYCMARHCAFLLGRGRPAGDRSCATLTTEEVLGLVQRPFPSREELEALLGTLRETPGPLRDWPEEGGSLEACLFSCCAPLFLRRGDFRRCQAELRRVLGDDLYGRLLAFLSFVRAAHFWAEEHPDLAFEEDLERLLAEEPRLAEWLGAYASIVAEELLQRAGEAGGSGAALSTLEERLVQRSVELRRTASVFRDSSNTIFIKDLSGTIVDVNPAAERELGWAREELVGQSIKMLVPSEEHARRDELMQRLQRGEEVRSVEGSHVTRSGDVRPALLTLSLLADDAGRPLGVATISQDLSKLRQAEAALRVSEARFRAVFDNAVDAMIIIDDAGAVESFNPAAERMFSRPASEVVGRNVAMLMPSPHSGEHDDYIARYLRTGRASIIGVGREVEAVRRDGTSVPVDLGVSAVHIEGERKFIGILHDLTERNRLEAEYRQVQKMEAIGRLAGGVAHDFNNLLAGVLGGMRIAMKALDEGHPSLAMLREVREELARGATITRRLLDFSRTGVPPLPRPVDPCETIRAAAEMIGRLLGEDIEVRIDCRTAGTLVLADPGMIEQALLNLAINARDAMPDGGRLAIECWDQELARADLERLGSDAAPGPFVVVAVTDDGAGMDAATLQRATEAFFTTKGPGMGTGLGLCTVESTVRGWGGCLELESTPGAGTRVRAYLPRAEAPVEPGSPELDEPAEEAPEGRTILVVEDEKLVRLGVQHLLEELGYTVLSTADPRDALELLRARGAEIDLLLTDVVLPGMGGPELVTAAHALLPRLKTLFMSAFPQQELVARGRIEPGALALEKPFTSAAVSAKVRAALRSTPAPA